MRPVYENDESLLRERSVAQALANKWMVALRKLPKYYSADYLILSNNSPRAFCEIKCRDISSSFDTYRISLNKYIGLRTLSLNTGLSSLIVVQFKDNVILYHIVTTDNDIPISYGGRTDRNDWQDIEPLAVLNYSQFIKI
jgi:hypothetical protein